MSAALWLALCTLLLINQGSAQFLEEQCGIFNPYVGFKGPLTTPWLAQIRTKSKVICAGTLINEQYVLTAASCIANQNQLIVRLGKFEGSKSNFEDDGTSDKTYEEYYVKKAFIHKSYSADTKRHNIGVLKLASSVQYKRHIKPICIAENSEFKTDSLTFEIPNEKYKKGFWCGIGVFFGSSCADEKKEEYLTSILIGSPWNKTIATGPLLRYTQHGVLSYRDRETYADVYTNVFAYADWIVAQVLEVEAISPNSERRNGNLQDRFNY
ncbi:phenoloxidase-activating enzyme 1 [Drosophila gunungcola]|nr:phenoloxidase-activating enzyme 1 [Drosophila gunungcola]